MRDVLEHTGWLDPDPAHALAGLLDVDAPSTDLPLLWHAVYLLDRPRQADLGTDGHPARNHIPLPPRPGLRRMFAGGRVTTHRALRLGAVTTRRTEVVKQQAKQGRSGTLIFLTVASEYRQEGGLCVLDEQDLVYLEPVRTTPVAVVPADATAADDERVIKVDPTLLFRFSALTYNAHRIHYDREFAANDEGYPGLLVHGPLQSLLMAERARATGRTAAAHHFEYRLESPLFDNQGCVVGACSEPDGVHTWVRDAVGRQTASGRLSALDT